MVYIPTIEKGVPVSASRRIGERKPVPFRLDRLDIGDSCFVPFSAYTGSDKRGARHGLRSQISTSVNHRDMIGRKLATRTSGDGIRVWRLA